jgi:hypothetical protein
MMSHLGLSGINLMTSTVSVKTYLFIKVLTSRNKNGTVCSEKIVLTFYQYLKR